MSAQALLYRTDRFIYSVPGMKGSRSETDQIFSPVLDKIPKSDYIIIVRFRT